MVDLPRGIKWIKRCYYVFLILVVFGMLGFLSKSARELSSPYFIYIFEVDFVTFLLYFVFLLVVLLLALVGIHKKRKFGWYFNIVFWLDMLLNGAGSFFQRTYEFSTLEVVSSIVLIVVPVFVLVYLSTQKKYFFSSHKRS